MKITKLLFIIISFIFVSCSSQLLDPEDVEIVNFEIHFLNDFHEDDVLLKFDNNNIYVGKLTTDYTISLAKAFQLQAYKGEHLLRVNLNNMDFITKQFSLTDSLYILIRYSPDSFPDRGITQGINVEMTHQRPVYD